jgi:hypothetical protein
MLIGFSGPQGCGKSTLLATFAKDSLFHVDDYKVSRAVQAELQWDSLQHATSSFSAMVQFQDTIFKYKRKREIENLEMTDGWHSLVLTERTFADILAYTRLWTYNLISDNKVGVDDGKEYIYSMAIKCQAAQRELYDAVVYIPKMDHVAWENDPHRASEGTSSYIDLEISDFVRRQEDTVRLHTVISASVNDRMAEVAAFLMSIPQ